MISVRRISKKTKEETATEIIASIFILLFVYTASSKLLELPRFELIISTSPLIGPFAGLLAWMIPTVEIGISALLILPRMRKTALLLTTVLMASFTGYVSYMLLAESKLPCSCGGIMEHFSWRQHLAVNILLTAVSALGYYYSNRINILLQ